MNEEVDLFEPSHERLLSIATWARYLAWTVIVVYILWTIAIVIEFQNTENYSAALLNRPSQDLMSILIDSPLKAFGLGVDMASRLLRGIVYYLILKGTSLGLNMIVETDINYRVQEGVRNE